MRFSSLYVIHSLHQLSVVKKANLAILFLSVDTERMPRCDMTNHLLYEFLQYDAVIQDL